jgi:hypothetical protein
MSLRCDTGIEPMSMMRARPLLLAMAIVDCGGSLIDPHDADVDADSGETGTPIYCDRQWGVSDSPDQHPNIFVCDAGEICGVVQPFYQCCVVDANAPPTYCECNQPHASPCP